MRRLSIKCRNALFSYDNQFLRLLNHNLTVNCKIKVLAVQFHGTMVLCEKKGECKIIYFIQGNDEECTIIYEDVKWGRVETEHADCSALKLIKELCAHHELDFDGCRKAVSMNHGFKQKIPVLIKENWLLLYPLKSLRDKDCIWINYYAVRRISGNAEQSTLEFGRRASFSERMIQRALARPDQSKSKASYSFAFDVRMIRQQTDRCRRVDDFVKQRRYKILD